MANPSFNLLICIAAGAIGLIAGAGAAAAEKRIALVIGNSAYQNTAALPNPRNDAEDVAAQLKGLGFQVITGLDLDKAGMDIKITEFAQALNGADVSVFFYGGHALQHKGQNYLVPTDAKLMTAPSLEFEMVRLELVQQVMEGEAKTNIIFLDACRDNPLARNLARALKTRGSDFPRGLAPVESGIGTLISFSTQPGSVAFDGDGRNSPFASALVKHIGAEQPVTDVLIAVRNDVVEATGQQQVPWEHSALRSKFYFKGPAASRVAAAPTAAPAPSGRPAPTADPSFELQAELALWKSIKDTKNPALLQSFVDQFPNGRFAKTAQLMIADLKEEQTQLGVAEKRESDAAAAGSEQQLALAQAAEARRKADEAKRGSDYRAALEEARKAREAAEEAGRRQAQAEKAAEEARKRAEASASREETAAAAGAPTAVASLQDEAVTAATADAGPVKRSLTADPAILVTDIQKQLKRIGCYNSSVDGKWGDGSRAALEKFASATNTELDAEEPTEEALAALDASKPGACAQAASSGSDRKTTQPTRRRQARGTPRRQGGSTGTVIFGVGKGVGIGIGF